MAGITLEQAEAKLAEYLAAETKVLKGQRVEVDGVLLARPDLHIIHAGVDTWDNRVKQLAGKSSGRGRARTVKPGW